MNINIPTKFTSHALRARRSSSGFAYEFENTLIILLESDEAGHKPDSRNPRTGTACGLHRQPLRYVSRMLLLLKRCHSALFSSWSDISQGVQGSF